MFVFFGFVRVAVFQFAFSFLVLFRGVFWFLPGRVFGFVLGFPWGGLDFVHLVMSKTDYMRLAHAMFSTTIHSSTARANETNFAD